MAVVAVTTFTLVSCKDDEVARELKGKWEGTTGLGYQGSDGHFHEAEWTVIEFDQDVLFSSEGTGFWVDYYGDGYYEYFASEITWKVSDGGKTIDIQPTNKEAQWDYHITDFTLSKHEFAGSIYVNSNEPSSFTMRESKINLDEYKNHQGWHR